MDTHKRLTRERAWLLSEKYHGVERPDFFDDLTRLSRGEPLAYLIGHVPFLDTTIFLDSRPLIPRPETEYWAKHATKEINARAREKGGNIVVLDLCAGSGCIGVSVLRNAPKTRVDFCEIDTGLHPTIAKNLRANGISPARARVFGGDLFERIPRGTRYDFILANPPYLNLAQTRRVARSVRAHEPALALWGGTGGMEYLARILVDAPQYLGARGALYTEHEPEQCRAIHALAKTLPYASCETHQDQFGLVRYTRLPRAWDRGCGIL